MRENTAWKMQGLHDVQWTGTRRPQTAIWKIPKSDTRREKYSKSSHEHGHFYETHAPVFSPSPAFSLDSSSSSQVVDLHTSNGPSSGCYKCSNFSFPTDRKLPQIHSSTDLSKSNLSTDSSSGNLCYSGNHSNETYLTFVDVKTPWYINVLNEKEHCLLKLGEEINRLSRFEVESKRKDHIISTLKNEISQLQNEFHNILHSQPREVEETLKQSGRAGPDIQNEFPQAEEYPTDLDVTEEPLVSRSRPRDLSRSPQRNVSTTSLVGSLSDIQGESQMETESLNDDVAVEDQSGTFSAGHENQGPADRSVGEFNDRSKLIHRLQDNIEMIKKDYEMSKGVISSLQKLVSSSEYKLKKSECEKQVLQRELMERALQIQAMSNKFSSMREERKHEELMVTMERENYNLRELLSELKSEVTRRNNMIADFKNEIHRLQKEMTDYQTHKRMYEGDKNQLERQMQDLAASEQHAKVSLEIVQSKFERFRSKIIQAAYTAPGFKGPQVEISDTEILDTMQKIIADRSDFHQQLKQKGVNVPPLYASEIAHVKQTSSTTRRKAV
ncbi:coiled-coil domain-containing protein 27 [Pseudophryne corroboree]|uniref:coiled-coil domain-containing protein 27 n=1 Tax=Pseudophryne corroboree TaxID=495146 RepID=UPI003081866B